MLTVDTFGGYDNELSPQATSGFDTLAPKQPGYNAYAGSLLRYRRIHRDKLFEMGGGGYVNSFRNIGLTPFFGADTHARLQNRIGERHNLDLAGAVRSEPFYELSTFGPLRAEVAPGILPDATSSNGFSVRRSLYGSSSATLGSRWTRRATTSATVHYGHRDFDDDLGDGDTRAASFGYTQMVGRRSALVSSYSYADSEFLEAGGGSSPRTTHTVDLGYRHEHPFSATRSLSIGFGAGATRVHARNSVAPAETEYVTPSGYANMRLGVARTWSIRADYRRDVSVLEGLTPEPFNTDAALVHVGGLVHRRVELVLSAGYSNGVAGMTPDGRYVSYTGASQLRFTLSRLWSALVGHTYDAYQLRNVTSLPLAFPTRTNRHALRVGMALTLPLYGSFTDSDQPAGRN